MVRRYMIFLQQLKLLIDDIFIELMLISLVLN